MSEWWTYRLTDFLLFAPRTYYRLFELYNAAVFPAQIAAFALGIAILALVWRRPGTLADRLVAATLAALWLWVAVAYLALHYATINWAATYFAAGFALEAVLLLWTGVLRGRLAWGGAKSGAGAAGVCVFLFALVLQPLIGPLLGRSWQAVELFGVAPDPTVVATLGLLAASDRPRWVLFPLPLLWCALSGATLWTMAAPEAMVLPLAAAVALVLAVGRLRRRQPCDSTVRIARASSGRR